ncbi:kinesin-like protein KIF15 [Biomphalaria glabrata]|uniref:Kinesin-like protein KIF15 n=1 Tax=Biomphalaria glabrata TaxID=6526 RepID=A0A9W2YDS8_BIOGL|nr:kinesin-like protein KIF15 [Biomphalaria glabrata]XP_055860882.1 kinesin-like protein KIF15 [Biomphalaria glabrata]XP_055860883.1 kinesin-like protein KIF15 [Biomphalaria glabrata]
MDPSIRDSIQILLRVRPPDPSEKDFAQRVLDVNTVDNAIILHTKPEPTIFNYDNVADADTTQNHESQLTAKEEELQRVNMTLQKFEKDNKVLQAMWKHTEVCEQKAP